MTSYRTPRATPASTSARRNIPTSAGGGMSSFACRPGRSAEHPRVGGEDFGACLSISSSPPTLGQAPSFVDARSRGPDHRYAHTTQQ